MRLLIFQLSARASRIEYESYTLPTNHFGHLLAKNMAAEGVCPFPLPPSQYYKVYTDENVDKQIAPDPPHPADGAYSMFGASFEVFVIVHFVLLCFRNMLIR